MQEIDVLVLISIGLFKFTPKKDTWWYQFFLKKSRLKGQKWDSGGLGARVKKN